MSRSYAADTSVSVEKSRMEIERTLARYGAVGELSVVMGQLLAIDSLKERVDALQAPAARIVTVTARLACSDIIDASVALRQVRDMHAEAGFPTPPDGPRAA